LTLHEVSAKTPAMKQLFRLTITTCASIALALTALGGPAPSGKEMKQVAPAPAPECSWTGFYIGLNGGGLWSNDDAVHTTSRALFDNVNTSLIDFEEYGVAAADLATFSLNDDYASFIGGGQMGYNFEFWRIVLGPEVDIQGVTEGDHHASATSSITPDPEFPENPITQDATVSRRMDWLGTVRGRIGFTITPCLLIYGTGGLAYGEVDARTGIRQFVENDESLPNVYSTNGAFSSTQSGWCAGGGLEFMFWKRWSVKAEYLYFDLGTASYHLKLLNNFSVATTPPSLFTSTQPTSHTKFDGNIVRAGLNFHF
jgi:outer membrane immunogenic protein